jgi:hypothetical protein
LPHTNQHDSPSVADSRAYVAATIAPIDRTLALLEHFFDPAKPEDYLKSFAISKAA